MKHIVEVTTKPGYSKYKSHTQQNIIHNTHMLVAVVATLLTEDLTSAVYMIGETNVCI
jgi:hypothetical protein